MKCYAMKCLIHDALSKNRSPEMVYKTLSAHKVNCHFILVPKKCNCLNLNICLDTLVTDKSVVSVFISKKERTIALSHKYGF